MPAEPSRRTTPLPPDWPRTRARVLRRDGHRCVRCGARATHVDHRVPGHLGGTDDDSNLEALCPPCHATKTGREAQATQPRRTRTPEPHPGTTPHTQ